MYSTRTRRYVYGTECTARTRDGVDLSGLVFDPVVTNTREHHRGSSVSSDSQHTDKSHTPVATVLV
jgi:hypothetical protein